MRVRPRGEKVLKINTSKHPLPEVGLDDIPHERDEPRCRDQCQSLDDPLLPVIPPVDRTNRDVDLLGRRR